MDNLNKVLVSIIVPVYNVEKYLERCFDSLKNQTLKNIEIIAINDGSTDNSGKVLDSIAQSDSRIKVIHKQNAGVSSARNDGIDIATGQYIAFVDPDDYVSLDMYEHLINESENGKYDMVQCNCCLAYDDGSTKKYVDAFDCSLIGSKAILNGFMNDIILPSCWGKIFKKSFIGELRFYPGLPVAEDKLFIAQFLDEVNAIKTSIKICYFYYQRETSVTYEKLNDKHFADIYVFLQISKIKSNKNLDLIVRCHLAEKSLLLIQRIVRTDSYYEKFSELREILISNLKMVFTTPKFLLKDRICVIVICLFPGFFKWIYKKYIGYKLSGYNR